MATTTEIPTTPNIEPVQPPSIERVHIVATPGTCGGKPRIAGTRIPVKHVAIMHELQKMTLGEIIEGYPHLTLADLHGALAYYHDHKEELDREIKEDREWYERMLIEHPPLSQRIARSPSTDGSNAPLPPG